MLERMKLTDEGMQKPWKGNVRGLSIQEMFPTFKGLFLQIPDDVAFNVELSECSQFSWCFLDTGISR